MINKEEILSKIDVLCAICEVSENTYALNSLHKIKELLENEWLMQEYHYQQIKNILLNETENK